MPMFRHGKKQGFTLIELLVVIAIIALLAAIVLVSLNTARTKARDTKRIADLKQIQLALEMYYDDNGSYPNRHTTSTSSGWNSLASDLSAYISALPKDPKNSGNYRYYYDGGESDDYPGYGLMTAMEHSGNYHLVNDDGGYYNGNDCCYYEIGPEPSYDSGNWWSD